MKSATAEITTYSISEVATMLGKSNVTVGRMWKRGDLPRPVVNAGVKGSRFSKVQIDNFLAGRAW